MAVYAVGDVQGCCDELSLLLDNLNFDQARDHLWLVGDLVNRGPKSLDTLRLVKQLGDAAVCVLGNHDLHLLALARCTDLPVDSGNLRAVVDAPDAAELVAWLSRRPLAHFDQSLNTLLVHAGTTAEWSVEDTLRHAAEVETVLRSDNAGDFLRAMYGKQPDRWSPQLTGNDRLRYITNCLTRIRYCTPDGRLDLSEKVAPGNQAAGLVPWFEMPGRSTGDTRIVFGHWSTLGLVQSPALLALDTGCVWGGTLTAVQLDAPTGAQVTAVASLQPARFSPTNLH